MIIPVILAGGSGTRLWPLSREYYPKQLIDIVDENTLLQNTFIRLKTYEGVDRPIIICNNNHRFMVAEQFRMINTSPLDIILEPVGRNTAPALVVAAIRALKYHDDPILLVLPADHSIMDIVTFHKKIEIGEQYASSGFMVTFGIVPDAPETGYGYIKKGKSFSEGIEKDDAFAISEFVEKPDFDTAKMYVESGEYNWNSGMFMFQAKAVLDEFKKFVPDIVSACEKAVSDGKNDLDFFRLDKVAFEKCPSDSIDYAVMEKTDKGVMVPLKAGWNDLGSWSALWQVGEKDEFDNVTRGDVLVHDVKTSYLHADSRLIAAVGLENHIVVETSDAVLISPKDRVQDVKHLVDQLKKTGRDEAKLHKKVYRPWGHYDNVDVTDKFIVRKLTLKPGAKISLQKHFHRAEHWVVVSGTARVTKGEEIFLLKEDESTYIPLGITHRLENPGKMELKIIETITGSYLGDDDIKRYDDMYGR